MHQRAFNEGRAVLAALVTVWPVDISSDALSDARYYLAHSCPRCGAMLWPTELLDRHGRLVVAETLCDACLDPTVLATVDGNALIEALRDVVLCWPRSEAEPAYQQARAFLQAQG